MKRLVFALLVCGMGAVSFGALLPTFTKLVVLKGTTTDTVHYVLTDPVPDTAAAAAQRAALGVDAAALAAKPKVFYFMVAEVVFTPQFVPATGKPTGEGDIALWTMGAVEYGIGRHDATGVWQPKLAYAYDVGWAVDAGSFTWWSTKAKERTGDGVIDSANAADTFLDEKDGVAVLSYTSKLTTNKATGVSWYEPTVSSLTISYTQVMQQLVGAPAAWKDVQGGAGKVVFKQDTALTKLVNDPLGGKVGLGKVAVAIHDFLVKGKYPAVTPNLDPGNYYP